MIEYKNQEGIEFNFKKIFCFFNVEYYLCEDFWQFIFFEYGDYRECRKKRILKKNWMIVARS